MRNRFLKTEGFTLIELLISLSIIGIIGLIISTTTTRTIDLKIDLEDREALINNYRNAMNQLIEDISQAYLSPTNEEKTTEKPYTWFSFYREELHLTAMRNQPFMKDAKESELVEISYVKAKDKLDEKQINLVRRKYPIVDDEMDKGGTYHILAENIADFKLFFSNGEDIEARKVESIKEWRSYHTENLNQLPKAVKIELSFWPNIAAREENRKEDIITFSTMVFLNYTRFVNYEKKINF